MFELWQAKEYPAHGMHALTSCLTHRRFHRTRLNGNRLGDNTNGRYILCITTSLDKWEGVI